MTPEDCETFEAEALAEAEESRRREFLRRLEVNQDIAIAWQLTLKHSDDAYKSPEVYARDYRNNYKFVKNLNNLSRREK